MKSDRDLIKEFLEKGGQIEKIDYVEPTHRPNIGSTNKGPPNLLTLGEAEELYGVKQNREKKKKTPDYSGIDLSLIPEHLHKFITQPAQQENNNEGDTENEAK